MHDDHYTELHELKSKLVEELASYSKGEITTNNLGAIDTLAHAAKNVCKIMESMDEEGGYSNRMSPIYYRGNSYDGPYRAEGRDWNQSYDNRGRGPQANRDAMGRYSRDDGMLSDLYETMKNATDETTRRNIQSMINKMEGR